MKQEMFKVLAPQWGKTTFGRKMLNRAIQALESMPVYGNAQMLRAFAAKHLNYQAGLCPMGRMICDYLVAQCDKLSVKAFKELLKSI